MEKNFIVGAEQNPPTRKISTQSGHSPQKLKNSNTKSKMSFIALLLGLFLFGNANVFAQTLNINSPATWNQFVNLVNTTGSAGWTFNLMVNVGPGTPIPVNITQPLGVFSGTLNGNGNRITVNITSNATNVGLFSEIAGQGTIRNLVVDGFVTGGPNSVNVGGLVGQMSSGQMHNITNLSKVTGFNTVGGIIGSINVTSANVSVWISCAQNNGFIVGGRCVGGVVGSMTNSAVNSIAAVRASKNSGTLSGSGGGSLGNPTYMGGIVGAGFGLEVHVYESVNIGKLLSEKYTYAGGIIAYLGNGIAYANSNAGIVNGATNSVGGIVGWLGAGSSLERSINTNWISATAPNSGAIVGMNNGTVSDCFYDRQMCTLTVSIGAGAGIIMSPGWIDGLPTINVLGNNLTPILQPFSWVFANNLYPRPFDGCSFNATHPISLLSAAPIYLQNGERLDNVTQNFFVSNWNPFPPMNPTLPFPFQWGSFDDSVFPWTLIPRSVMEYIDVPPPPSGIAMINGSGSGWDTLSVRIEYWNLTPAPYPMNYEIIFEKVVPINVP